MPEPRFPYPSFRPGQKEVAGYVEKAVRENQVLLLQAPTGFGKTAAVIYGLLRASPEKVVYVVRTRNEIQPVVRELRRFNASFTFIYSARRMCPLFRREGRDDEEEDTPSIEDFWENCRLARLKGLCPYYYNLQDTGTDTIREVLREAGEDPYLAVSLLASYKLCPFFALKALIDEVQFIVATYPYIFNPEIFIATFEPLNYSDLVIVVDEAHSLVDAYTMMERRLSIRDLEKIVEELKMIGENVLADKVRKIREVISNRYGLTQGVRRIKPDILFKELGSPDDWATIAQEVRLRKISEALTGTGRQAVKTYTSRLALLLDALEKDAKLYVVVEKGRIVLKALPIDPCKITETPLNEAKAAIMMSGTMPPSNVIRDVLCVHKKIVTVDVELFHPEIAANYTSHRRVIVAAEPTSKYSERSSRMYQLYASYLQESLKCINRGVVLAVFPSYEFAQLVARNMDDIGDETEVIVEEQSTTISEVYEAIKGLAERRALIIAVAGGKLVEGVEYVDSEGKSLVRLVFIGGVPYPQPDPIFEDYVSLLSNKLGESRAKDYAFNVTATIRVRQAIGRAQRRPGDRVVAILADRRFLYRRIRELLRLKIDYVVFDLDSFRKRVAKAVEELGVGKCGRE